MREQNTPKQIERRQKKALGLKVLLLVLLTNAFTALWMLPSSPQKSAKTPQGYVKLEIRAKNFTSLSGLQPAHIHIFDKNFTLLSKKALLFHQKGKSRWEKSEGTFVVAVKESDVEKLAQTKDLRLYPFSKNIPKNKKTPEKAPQPKEAHVYQIVF